MIMARPRCGCVRINAMDFHSALALVDEAIAAIDEFDAVYGRASDAASRRP
jgi:hypothetical protein